MWWIFQMVYTFLCNSALEFVIFILVDVVAKTILKDARSEDEKRKIWLYESLILTVVSILVHLVDHQPYMLLLLTVLTFIYTQLLGRVDFRHWWRHLMTRWEESQHLTENVKFINEQMKFSKHIEMLRKQNANPAAPPVSKPVLKRLSEYVFRNQGKSTSTNKPSENAVSSAPEARLESSVNPPGSAMPEDSFSTSLPFPVRNPAYSQQPLHSTPIYNQAPRNKEHVPPSPQQSNARNWFTKNDLRRRPLRTYQTSEPSPSSFSNSSKNMRSRFMSAFGFSGTSNKPTGIQNEGQNLCFMNCVIQCLSRSPGLVEQLALDVREDFDCSVAETVMLTTLVEIMSQCSGKTRSVRVIDPSNFREAVSVLNERLVAPPAERQHQQDSAEFFTWLMETLHNTLNKRSTPGVKKALSESLQMLKFIYGDLTQQRIEALKTACRKEISEANGLKNDSYAEPIQRLSDLEWLTYKQRNHSVVDSTFTGQLVEARHCLLDNHLTVNTQTFNILPVPIVAPRDVSGLVFLEDCFTKFCHIEHLVGKEGLECTFCNKNQGTPVVPSHANRVKASARASGSRQNIPGSVDSAIHSPKLSSTCMSPIVGQYDRMNDSGFQDNVFRTSTPIGESIRFTFQTQRLQDAERRCLLRQLPDCLVIQLLRFTYNQYSQQSRKINAPISIPLKGLDLTSIVYDNVTNREDLTAGHQNQKYDLYAVCVHLGAESTNCGHYICYCQAQDGVWYKFDDELVWDVNMEFEITSREIRENAYLLFYKRSQVEPQPQEQRQ